MKCGKCGSDKVYREHCSLDYCWVYHCLECEHNWLKTKHDAPGIAYAVSIKREKVKGHYRTVVRDQFGKIITSKKWNPTINTKQLRTDQDE